MTLHCPAWAWDPAWLWGRCYGVQGSRCQVRMGPDLDLALQSLRSWKVSGHLSAGIRLSNLPLTHSLWAQQCACLPQPCKDKTEIALPTGNKNRNMVKQIHVFLSPCGPTPVIWTRSCFQHSATWNGNKGLSQSRKEKMQNKSSLPMMDDLWIILSFFYFLSFCFLSVRWQIAFSIHPCGYRAQVIVCVLMYAWHVRGTGFSCPDDFC